VAGFADRFRLIKVKRSWTDGDAAIQIIDNRRRKVMTTATATARTNHHGYTYQAALAASQKVNWRIEDIIGSRWTYLGTGMTHPNFLATLESLFPPARTHIEQIAPMFC
jgi:hypothetical protein